MKYFLFRPTIMAGALLYLSSVCVVQAQTAELNDARVQLQAWQQRATQAAQAGDTASAAQANQEARVWLNMVQELERQSGGVDTGGMIVGGQAQIQVQQQGQTQIPGQPPAQPQQPAGPTAAQIAQQKANQELARTKKLQNELTAAITQGDYNLAKNIVQRGAVATPEMTQRAIDGGYTGIAYMLMRAGGEVTVGVLGRSLFKAVQQGDQTRVKNVLKLGANVNYSEDGLTALGIASRNHDMSMIGLLIQQGSNRDADELGRVMFRAAQNRDINKVTNLLRLGANPNYGQNGETALSLAIRGNELGLANALITGGAVPDRKLLSRALVQAVQRGESFDRIRLLIKMGADVNSSVDGITPLFLAINSGNAGLAASLIAEGATDSTGRFGKKLFEAALTGDMTWVNVLSKVDTYKRYRNGQGETPLHAAASTGQVPAMQVLLQSGVDPNILTPKSWTPLHHAARFGHKLALIHLLKAGSDVYAVNSDGYDAQKLANVARRDEDVDTQGVLEYLRLWISYHPRPGS